MNTTMCVAVPVNDNTQSAAVASQQHCRRSVQAWESMMLHAHNVHEAGQAIHMQAAPSQRQFQRTSQMQS